jgi:DMSO/TMAO reductase YedYZ molybdopterin-dependent catalytic subunit
LPATPLGRLLGDGLDARLFTDLSTLSPNQPDSLVIDNDRFYVRTACPAAIRSSDANAWSLAVAGLVQSPSSLSFGELERLPPRGGTFLLECAGNSDQSNLGLMGACEWQGVPILSVVDRFRPTMRSFRVLVSGTDDPGPSRTSVPGASWIFSPAQLERALLAFHMNGTALPRDHGVPVRLIVPGWYGCACIKWVNRIEIVPDDSPATGQMEEFAARTHQNGEPTRARDYLPAVIDTSAMPIRVEKWLLDGHLVYRIVGIVWGGSRPTNALSIRFKTSGPWVKVEDCPLPKTADTWSLWTHTWRPESPGRYQIVLRVDDRTIRTRRLDLFFYVREVQIDEI